MICRVEVLPCLVLQSVSYNSVLAGNPALENPCGKPKKSDRFWACYKTDGLEKALKRYCRVSFIKKIYRFCGRLYRKTVRIFKH